MKGSRREPGDPTGAIDRSSMGMQREGRPERCIELRSEVGPVRSTCETPEGDESNVRSNVRSNAHAEGVEGRDWREGSPLKGARVRTLSRVALLPHLRRVYDAARHDKHARFTALLHHVDVAALTRAFWRCKRSEAQAQARELTGSRSRPTSRTWSVIFKPSVNRSTRDGIGHYRYGAC